MLARFPVVSLERLEALGEFQAVGADVLDRRRTDRTRDQREVLEARYRGIEQPRNGAVPVLSRTDTHEMPATCLAESLDAIDFDPDDQAFEVAGEKHVAATAEHEERHRSQIGIGQQLRQMLPAADTRKACRACLDTEGVVGRQADIAFDVHRHRTIVGASA